MSSLITCYYNVIAIFMVEIVCFAYVSLILYSSTPFKKYFTIFFQKFCKGCKINKILLKGNL